MLPISQRRQEMSSKKIPAERSECFPIIAMSSVHDVKMKSKKRKHQCKDQCKEPVSYYLKKTVY